MDINDALYADAKRVMARRQTTLRTLIEEGLRRVVRDDEVSGPFELRDASVGEGGLVEGVSLDWKSLSSLIYPDRGR